MNPNYITFEQAEWLKSKEFDEECRMCMADDDERPLPFNAGNSLHKNSIHPYYSAPEQHQLVDWLLEKHDIWISVIPDVGMDLIYTYKIYSVEVGVERCLTNGNNYDTPQEVYSAAFDYIKDNNLI